MTGRVQFREDEDAIRFVVGLGLNPNELAREAFEAEVRRLRAKDKAARLRRFRVRLKPGDAARLVRADREER